MGLHYTPDAYFKTDAQRKANPEGWLKQLSDMDEQQAGAMLMDVARNRPVTDAELQAAKMTRNQWLNFVSDAGGVIGPMVAYLGHAFGNEKIEQLGFDSAHTSQSMGNLYGGPSVEDGRTFNTLGLALTSDGDALRRIRNLVVNGAGSMLAFTTAPGGAAGAGTIGALSTVGSIYTEAVDAGVDKDTAFRVAILGVPAGMLEAFGVHSGSITKEIRKKVMGDFVKEVLKSAGKGMAKESLQEGAQQILTNMVRKGLISPDIELMEGVGPAMLAGAILGGAGEASGRVIGQTKGRFDEHREGQRQQREMEAPARLMADGVGENISRPGDMRPRLVRDGQQVAVAPVRGDAAPFVSYDEASEHISALPEKEFQRAFEASKADPAVQQAQSQKEHDAAFVDFANRYLNRAPQFSGERIRVSDDEVESVPVGVGAHHSNFQPRNDSGQFVEGKPRSYNDDELIMLGKASLKEYGVGRIDQRSRENLIDNAKHYLAEHSPTEIESIPRPAVAAQGAASADPLAALKSKYNRSPLAPEVEAQLTEHALSVEEVKHSAGVDRSKAPEWVKKSDKYVKDLASGKIQNANPVEGFIHLARVTAWDAYKSTGEKAAWAREMTLRLGARVRPQP